MKRTAESIILGLLILSIASVVCASDTGITTEQHTIKISTSEKGLLVEENILITNSGIENATSVRLWIQQGIQDVQILAVESGEYLTPIIAGNIRECNLTQYNLTLETGESLDLELTYILPTNTENFEKTISYDTSSLSVTFNKEPLYQVQKAQPESSFSLRLYRPTEAPLSIAYIVVIFILVVILITSTLLLLRKQRSKVKSSFIESEEILSTKKALLLSLLKDLEKQHRSKTLSDDTYDKLKEEYKQQAVEVMKKLEDIKK
ncbi:MAG: hypothetical protein JSW60_01850 [Thermoplasmatales archaeon]|nr:MAG: hypothetical protein JSW60_01850 [Thermoplasmatales archaeon]